MFETSIETVASFTRPIHVITRNFGSNLVLPGSGTLFFVNNDGWALTCGHIADELLSSEQLLQRYNTYRAEYHQLQNPNREARRKLEKKYGYNERTVVQAKFRFMNVGTGDLQIHVKRHAIYDVALLQFATKPQFQQLPVFARVGAELKQGKFLCRLGFPFPEFTNFAYDATVDEIDWTSIGQDVTPQFPIDGMVTRHLGGQHGEIMGFELSTPGLRGQSGGPAFDANAVIWGMQSMTRHLDLDFDVDQEVLRRGITERRHDSAFLHVGNCIHVEILKAFMREHGVTFSEA